MASCWKEDITAVMARDPAAKSKLEILLCYPGVKALRSHRLANRLYKKGHTLLARLISQRCKRKTGIEIHPGATIGHRLFIDHGAGVVIGETAEIGDDVTLYQGVTLGNNVKVGAGAIVLKPVPDGCTVVGNPGRIVRRKDGSRPTLDHNNLPDPMLEKMDALYERISELEAAVRELTDEKASRRN